MRIQVSHSAGSKSAIIRLSMILVLLLCFCGCGNDVHHAAWKGDINAVKSWIDKGGDVNARHSRSGGNILSYAAGSGNLHLVEYLIVKGADIADRTGDSTTPLHYACREGHDRIVAFLLSKGANPNAKADRYKRSYGETLEGTRHFPYEGTPLHWVIDSKLPLDRKIIIVRLLLDAGADPEAIFINPVDRHLYSPLSIAKGLGLPEIVKLLEAHKKAD